jgi:hypothetical protein
MCAKGIEFASYAIFLFDFWNFFYSVVYFFLVLLFFPVCGADSVASRKEAVADLAWLKAHTTYTYYGVNITHTLEKKVIQEKNIPHCRKSSKNQIEKSHKRQIQYP